MINRLPVNVMDRATVEKIIGAPLLPIFMKASIKGLRGSLKAERQRVVSEGGVKSYLEKRPHVRKNKEMVLAGLRNRTTV